MDNANLSEPQQSVEWQRLKQEGPAALAQLFTEYREPLERIIAFRIDPRLRSRMDAADVLQEAYLQTAERIEEACRTANVSFFVWLRQKVIQVLIDLHRQHFRDKRNADREIRLAVAGEEFATSLSIARFLIADITSPSGAAVRAEEAAQLEQALQSMQEIDREVLALRHFEHLTNQQVAEVLGLSPTAASNRYIRAAARLSEIMECVKQNLKRDIR